MIKIYDFNYRGNCQKEADEQAAFVEYLRTAYKNTYGLVVVHIENEGRRTYGQAIYAKKAGQTKGASDILIPGNPAFCCELKRKDRTKSRVRPEQVSYLESAAQLGSFACIAYGYDAAVAAFNDYLRIAK